MSTRKRWACPGCQTVYAVPSTAGLTVCPSCSEKLTAKPPPMSDHAPTKNKWPLQLGIVCAVGLLLFAAGLDWSPERRAIKADLKSNRMFPAKILWTSKPKPANQADLKTCSDEYDAELRRTYSIADPIEKARLAGGKSQLRELKSHPNGLLVRVRIRFNDATSSDHDEIYMIEDGKVVGHMMVDSACESFTKWADRQFPAPH